MQFMDRANDGAGFAVKFYLSRKAFERELALYERPELRKLLVPIAQVCENRNAEVRSPRGYVFPPFAIMERCEVWLWDAHVIARASVFVQVTSLGQPDGVMQGAAARFETEVLLQEACPQSRGTLDHWEKAGAMHAGAERLGVSRGAGHGNDALCAAPCCAQACVAASPGPLPSRRQAGEHPMAAARGHVVSHGPLACRRDGCAPLQRLARFRKLPNLPLMILARSTPFALSGPPAEPSLT